MPAKLFPSLRRKILTKLAQSTSSGGSSIPKTPTTVSGAPPNFIASNFFPSLILGFSSRNLPIINSIGSLLNTAIFFASDGYGSLERLREQNFSFPADQSQNDLKSLVQFAGQVNSLLFTDHGKNFSSQLSPEEIANRSNSLFNSISLGNLSQTNPSSQLAQKVGSNVKSQFQNLLQQLK